MQANIYEIMHMDKVVARISTNGLAEILLEQFMPYDLFLEEDDDIDARVNNLNVEIRTDMRRIGDF